MEIEPILTALANRHRIKLINVISEEGNKGIIVSAATELLGVSQPTVSHHLLKMKEANLLDMNTNSCFMYR